MGDCLEWGVRGGAFGWLGDITIVCPVLNGYTALELTQSVTSRSPGVYTSKKWSGIALVGIALGLPSQEPGRQV